MINASEESQMVGENGPSSSLGMKDGRADGSSLGGGVANGWDGRHGG